MTKYIDIDTDTNTDNIWEEAWEDAWDGTTEGLVELERSAELLSSLYEEPEFEADVDMDLVKDPAWATPEYACVQDWGVSEKSQYYFEVGTKEAAEAFEGYVLSSITENTPLDVDASLRLEILAVQAGKCKTPTDAYWKFLLSMYRDETRLATFMENV